MESLPVIDYSSDASRADKAAEVVGIMETLGFLFLENVPGYDEDELRWCVNFFYEEMPSEKKLQVARILYNPDSKQIYRGYFGVNQCGSSFKEGFEIGRDLPKDDPDYDSSFPLSEHNVWPHADEGEDNAPYLKFKETMLRYYKLLFDVGTDLVQLIAIGLGLEEKYFDYLFIKTISTFRLINYPVHNFEPPADAYTEDGKLISTAQHQDSVLLTLLTTFDYEGLQVERQDGSWLDVAPHKNSLIINLGRTLSKMTNNRVKATIHRVLAIGRQRRSVPFFLEPSFHSYVPRRLPDDKTMASAADYPRDDTFQYGPWMIDFAQRFIEFKGLKDYIDNKKSIQ